MRHGSHFEPMCLVYCSSCIIQSSASFSFQRRIPFDNIGAVRGLQTNSKATVEEKQQMVSQNNATSTFMFQSMRPLFIYHHIGMREGSKAIMLSSHTFDRLVDQKNHSI
jgi:hypothetical protein